jgi:beta-N-acetylhexosaminidase
MTLEALVGRRLMFGLPGPDLGEADIRLFRETHAAGVMLYRRNFETPERLHRLLTGLEEALGRRILVATDHEGGRVIMLGRAVTIFPDNLAAGTAGEAAFINRQGLFEGRELRRLGVDVNFSPVLDVLTERYSPNIGIRSYGKDPALVARYGAARIRGLQSAGVSACAKHFPGKGHAPVDAHLGLPVIDSDWDEMHATHLPPFLAAIEAGVDCIMTSHPLYPRLDPAPNTPATFSRLIVEEYLRGEIGYRGAIVSDDLEMGAIGELCSVGEATVRAAAAGHDLLLVCHTAARQREAHAELLEAYGAKRLPLRGLEQSAARLDDLQAKRAARFDGGPPSPERDGETLAKALATRAVTPVTAPSTAFSRALNGRVVAFFPRMSSLADRITIEDSVLDEARFVTQALAPYGIEPAVGVVGVEPGEVEIARASAAAKGADAAILFLYDAHLYPSNRALLDALQKSAPALGVILMRDPWDAEYLAPGVVGVTAYGWRRCQLDAALARLLAPAQPL